MSIEVMQAQRTLLLAENSMLAHQIIMAPSLRDTLSPRAKHSRVRHGGSIGRARASSNADEREVMIAKALTWILKRGLCEKDEEHALDIKFDEDGWADCGQVLQWQNLSHLSPTLQDLQALLQNTPRSRFELRPKSNDTVHDPKLASSWLIRGITTPTLNPQNPGTLLTPSTDTLPTLAIYATTYANYALILRQNILLNTGGSNITFSTVLPDTTDSHAEVLFYIDLCAAVSSSSGLTWYLDENELQLTVGQGKGVEAKFWKKVVGRKGDVGVLWEDGEVVRKVPNGCRGKRGDRGRGRNGRGKGGRRGSGGDFES